MSTVKLGYDFTKVYTTLLNTDPDNECPNLGTIFESADGKAYRFVVNNHASALVVGDVVFCDKTALYPNAVSVLNTDSCGAVAAGIMAGVAMGAIAAAGYGWIQFAGVGSAKVESTTDIVVGDTLKGVNSQVYAVTDAAVAVAASYYNHLRALLARTDNDAAVVANNVSVNCRVY